MDKISKTLAIFLMLIAALSCLIIDTIPISLAQSGTNVSGIINSDTTWTMSGSPYTFTGPVDVIHGITLTIEAGTTVNLQSYYIQVDGTLTAKGSSVSNINLNGGSSGSIRFTKSSPSWNENKGTGSIIEKCIIKTTSIAIMIGDTSPKINNNTIVGCIWMADSTSTGQSLTAASPIITNNQLIGNDYPLVLQISTSPLIAYNTIKGNIETGTGSTIISHNNIEGSIESNGQYDYISDNTIIGNGGGYGIRTGFGTIERNLIMNYHDAIAFWIAAFPIIQNNTIVNNANGISVVGYDRGSRNPQIRWNNLENNSEYNVKLSMYETYPNTNINATYNWWGTVDTQIIGKTIQDYKNDFNLGNVSFVPFLTSPNPQALPNQNSGIPVANTSPTPNTPTNSPTPILTSPSPTIPEFSWLTILLILLTIPIALITVRKKLLKKMFDTKIISQENLIKPSQQS